MILALFKNVSVTTLEIICTFYNLSVTILEFIHFQFIGNNIGNIYIFKCIGINIGSLIVYANLSYFDI